jgi:hypothetical protein
MNSRVPRDLGVVELTPQQVQRLDNLLSFYRENDQDGGCTTSDTVSIVLYWNGCPVRQERLVDSTCESELLADADPRDLAALKRHDAPVLSFCYENRIPGLVQAHGTPAAPRLAEAAGR